MDCEGNYRDGIAARMHAMFGAGGLFIPSSTCWRHIHIFDPFSVI